ncbi:MAG: T9SS type A sorting domain-containing protein [FCB group bacterium]|nr:T9SS type A sorting domain-containing protein [FCB group bacterium]MBL7028282.1 T9SS type A sorting domain-containing protein [Candidatus Neomarinimicrobiota bacterium]MBL7121601.1 T9SS type A sorting domain-containing protein [Candidatus Neomarinimicrobiota bacterium]
MALFDGINWTIYNDANSGLPDNDVNVIVKGESGNMWIGTGGGLASFDGTDWTVYDHDNSGLVTNGVKALAIDRNGKKWIGTVSGLSLFDGTNWTGYNTQNSGLPSHSIRSIAIDFSDNKWFGTWALGSYDDGLTFFDGADWVVYETSNSGLPDNWVRSISIDNDGNKWIGTSTGGLGVFNEGGIILGTDDEGDKIGLVTDFRLNQNYPNPFNPTTTISYELPEQLELTLTIYDITGREVMTLVHLTKSAGQYEIQWNGADDSGKQVATGMYFAQLRTGDFSQVIKMVYLR